MGKKRSTPEQSSDDEIETFYHQRDEQLRKDLEKTTSNKKKKSVSWAFDNDDDDEGGRDEVLAFDDDSNESDVDQEIDANDDNDEEDEEEDLTGAWGSERKIFYNEDENENDEDAKLEEQEATLIQKRYYEMLQKKDFALELFQEKPSVLFSDQHLDEQSRQRHIILPDNLADLSVNDRLQLLRDQSPELEILAREFRNLFDDLKLSLLPFVHAVIETSSLNEFEKYSGWTFVLTVLELYLVSCSYMSLYLAMKSSDTNFSKHPIENQIEQYRNLCALIHDDFQAIKPDLLKLRELLQERKSNGKIPPPVLTLSNGFSLLKKANGTKPKLSLRERMKQRREKAAEAERVEEPEQQDEEEEEEEEEEPKVQKRAITYQIEKNKGLTIRRKKEYRNPRVRHRNKYARALVKRKSRVPTARTEEEKYGGEPTGIRAGIKRGIKLKS